VGWLTGWSYRRPVTIDNTNNSNELTDYQVLVVVDTASLIQQGKMQSDCDDIRFTDSDGTTLLPYWIEGPINANNTKIWVKVPQIPANGTKTIYLYYGNPTAQSESSITNTFIREIDSEQPVKAAWAMNEGSGSTVYDTSGMGNNGTIYGATWISGRYGYALSFDGGDDQLYKQNATGLPANNAPQSIVAWIYHTRGNVVESILGLVNHSMSSGIQLGSRGNNRFSVWMWGGTVLFSDPNPLSLNVWTHWVYTFDGTTHRLYRNGSLVATSTTEPQTGVPSLLIVSGWTPNAPYELFRGYIDEILILNRVLTAVEISDLYNYYGYTTLQYPGRVLVRKRSDPEPITTVGNEETGAAPPIVIVQRRMLIMSI
jgi:hypothetical protein